MGNVNRYKTGLAADAWAAGSVRPLSDDGKCIVYKNGTQLCVEDDNAVSWQALWEAKFKMPAIPSGDVLMRKSAAWDAMNREFDAQLHKANGAKGEIVNGLYLLGSVLQDPWTRSALIMVGLCVAALCYIHQTNENHQENQRLENELIIEKEKIRLEAQIVGAFVCDGVTLNCSDEKFSITKAGKAADNTFKIVCGENVTELACNTFELKTVLTK